MHPQGSSRLKLRLYPSMEELVSQTQDRAVKLAQKSRPLQRVLPLKRHSFSVADYPDYTTPRWLNLEFARLTGNNDDDSCWLCFLC